MSEPAGYEIILTIHPDRFGYATPKAADEIKDEIIDLVNTLAYVTNVQIVERVRDHSGDQEMKHAEVPPQQVCANCQLVADDAGNVLSGCPSATGVHHWVDPDEND